MKKIDMIKKMVDDGFCVELEKKFKYIKDENKRRAAIINQLQYHTLKKEIEEKYENYLTYCQMSGIM